MSRRKEALEAIKSVGIWENYCFLVQTQIIHVHTMVFQKKSEKSGDPLNSEDNTFLYYFNDEWVRETINTNTGKKVIMQEVFDFCQMKKKFLLKIEY